MQILIVDDEPFNRQVIAMMIKKSFPDAVIEFAYNGKEAVEKAVTQKFDMIFMDIRMPVMNGFEATKRLREKGIESAIYVVTADVIRETLREALNCGANGVVQKPINMKELERILNSRIEDRSDEKFNGESSHRR